MGTHPIFESDFDCLTDMSSSEEQTEKLKFSESKEMKNISVQRFPCQIDCPDGTPVDVKTWFNPTIREMESGSTALFRGRPLQGKTHQEGNFYLVKQDPSKEDVLMAVAKVDKITDWQVQPAVDDKFSNFATVVPAILSALHD